MKRFEVYFPQNNFDHVIHIFNLQQDNYDQDFVNKYKRAIKHKIKHIANINKVFNSKATKETSETYSAMNLLINKYSNEKKVVL